MVAGGGSKKQFSKQFLDLVIVLSVLFNGLEPVKSETWTGA